jgi:hypothetical protein
MHAITRAEQSAIPTVAGVCVAASIVALALIRAVTSLAQRRQGSR